MAASSRGAPPNPPMGGGSNNGGGGKRPPQDPFDPYKNGSHYQDKDDDDDALSVFDTAKRMRVSIASKKSRLAREKDPSKRVRLEEAVREQEASYT